MSKHIRKTYVEGSHIRPDECAERPRSGTAATLIARNQKRRYHPPRTCACTDPRTLSGLLVILLTVLNMTNDVREAPFVNSPLSLQIVYGYDLINQTNSITSNNYSLRKITNQTHCNTHNSLTRDPINMQGVGIPDHWRRLER